MSIKIKEVERITVHVPFTPRCQIWCAREQYQWDISEVIRHHHRRARSGRLWRNHAPLHLGTCERRGD